MKKREERIKEMENILKKDPIVKEIGELKDVSAFMRNIKLVGGAVLDIIEGREPKDYDFVIDNYSGITDVLVEKLGYKFVSSTRTAMTLEKTIKVGEGSSFKKIRKVTVQILNFGTECFDYTISQSQYSLSSKKLAMDLLSYDSKILVPVNFTRAGALKALHRMPLYNKKGYNLPEITYLSLLGLLGKSSGSVSRLDEEGFNS